MKRLRIDKIAFEQHRAKTGKSLERLQINFNTLNTGYVTGCKRETIEEIARKIELAPERFSEILVPEDRVLFQPSETLSRPAETVLRLDYRRAGSPREIRSKCYKDALSSGGHVLYARFMTQKRGIERVAKDLADNTILDVLTWNPRTDAEIKGLAKHLNETGSKVQQVREGLVLWKEFAAIRPNVNLYTYESTPTMQAMILEDKWALVELFPFDVTPENRPALFLRDEEDAEREAFVLFAHIFEWLFRAAKKVG